MFRGFLFFLCVAAGMAADFPAPYDSETDKKAVPLPAEEAAATMKLPPGFRAQVFAAEPQVLNPIAMAWDSKGRMWVAENFTYAEGRKRFELSLRDRLLILEDKDGDGRAETRKVFTDEVQMLTSVALGRGGVWLMCPPQVLFIPDRDEDGSPDGPPQVVLDGFTVSQSNYHNYANGLRFGPDGWLYGRCGHSCPGRLGVPGTTDAERVPIKGGIWRFHPERNTVEVLTHGTTNPWGHDWDAHGEMFFINTVNGHLWHLIHGAHLVDSNPSPNPGVYHRLDTIADHYHFDRKGSRDDMRAGTAGDFGGGHAHVGMMIYQGSQWPVKYRGKLFTLNLHGRRANMERLERHDSGYVGRHEPDFFLSADPFFRGIDLSTGPDGSVYVLDWSDTGECHEYTGVHRNSGRIFKISHAPSGTPPSEPATVLRLRELWQQYRDGKTTRAQLLALLNDPDEHLRVWGIRLLTDEWPLDTIVGPLPHTRHGEDAEARAAFVKLAGSDPSGLVRLSLASTLLRLPVAKRVELATALVSRSEDAEDAQLPAMVWFGLIPVAEQQPQSLVAVARACAWPDTLRWIARNLTGQMERDPAPLNELLTSVAQQKGDRAWRTLAVLSGMNEATQGWRKAPKPAAWDEFCRVADLGPAEAGTTVRIIRDLSVVFGDGRALEEVRKAVTNEKAELAARQSALKTLIEARPEDLEALCISLLEARGLNALAARGLALSQSPEAAMALARQYRRFAASDRPAVMETLVSRTAFARILLEEMAAGRIPREDLNAFHARQIRAMGDAGLTQRLSEVWGDSRETAADKRQMMAEVKARLTPPELARADLGQGRLHYQTLCAACHTLYGNGGKIGPDLTGSGRANLDYLLENIVDPSAVIGADQRMNVVTLKDGRILSGTIAAQDKRAITLRQLTGESVIARAEIVKQEIAPLSMMPEGMLLTLQPAQIRDLMAYLMHPVQAPLPK